MIKHIFFDLDGTLLPMRQEAFIRCYMPLLAKAYIDAGLAADEKTFTRAVWEAFAAMIANDGSRCNCEVFWDRMAELLPIEKAAAQEIANRFYGSEFNRAKAATMPSPLANEVIQAAKARKIKVYLTTNPVFPRIATQNRIKWAGLDEKDFEVITTYEDNRFCKPNVAYFREVIEQFGIDVKECLMVGNDVSEDLVIRRLGVATFLVTDTMENNKNLPIETDYQGTLADLLAFIKRL